LVELHRGAEECDWEVLAEEDDVRLSEALAFCAYCYGSGFDALHHLVLGEHFSTFRAVRGVITTVGLDHLRHTCLLLKPIDVLRKDVMQDALIFEQL
jgi:hypothetical protein